MRNSLVWVLVLFALLTTVFYYRHYRLVHPHRDADQIRTYNALLIGFEAETYYLKHKEVPDDLGEIIRYGRLVKKHYLDPRTGKPLEYKKLSVTTYRVCVDFDKPSPPEVGVKGTVHVGDPLTHGGKWVHGQGHQCFTRNAVI